ncbi:glutamine--tRNA ligase, partial [Enterococcus hirae]
DGRKVRGTIHWVCARNGVTAEIRRFQHLFAAENPGAEADLIAAINAQSVEVLTAAVIEPSLAAANSADAVQFERLGYFCADPDGTSSA